MNCPACSNQLSIKTVSDVNLDVCDNGCGGIWFDQFEFKKFDEPKEPDVETLLNINRTKKISVPKTSQHNCPKCIDIIMMRRFSSVKHQVTVDECAQCAGIWLDSGELHEIRNEFTSEADRQKAAEALFSEMFDPHLNKLKTESAAKLKKAQTVARALRFICPSYYIKGKQDWGAF